MLARAAEDAEEEVMGLWLVRSAYKTEGFSCHCLLSCFSFACQLLRLTLHNNIAMVKLQNILSTALLASRAAAVSETVDLGYTKYVGKALSNGISEWLGMRFAAAPLGELRFMPPQDPPRHHKPQPADTVSGKDCM